MFHLPQFTIKDVVSVIVDWFLGRIPSLKSMIIVFKLPVLPGDLEHEYLKPMPFEPERRPAGLVDTAGEFIDLSDGLDIVRSDGELATIYAYGHKLLFHVWSEGERRGLPWRVNLSYISKRSYRLVKLFKSPVTFMILYLDGEGICLELKPVDEQLESNRFDEKLLEDINYFTSLFRCSVDYLKIDGDYLSEDNIYFGFNKLKKLFITGKKEITNDKLTYLLEHFEVTETISINIPISNTFNCAPKLLKAKEIWFECGMSAGWVTGRFLSFLSHYDSVHQLMFNLPQFTIKDVISVIAKWFRGRAPSLKSMIITFKLPVHPRDLENEYFKPIPFEPERRPAVLVTTEGYSYDLSDALDIVRSDGELATIYVEDHDFWFHVWSEDERRRLPLK